VTKTIPTSVTGEDLPDEASRTALTDGTTITIRQMGLRNSDSETPYMEIGSSYLVFLTPTGLPDVPDTEFYITGAVAGLYEADSSAHRGGTEGDYNRLSDDADKIPSTLTEDDLLSL